MKVTIELSSKDVREICRATGEKNKEHAIRNFLQAELMLIRRRAFVDKCLCGDFAMELKEYERGQKLERKASEKIAKAWD